MNYLTDFAADEFAVYSQADNVSDWSSDSDEAGNPVFDPAAVAGQLQLDEF